MGDLVAAAALQFRRDPHRRQPPSAVGRPAGHGRGSAIGIHRRLVLEHGREALGTTPLDAEPNIILKMPGDTLVPLFLALAMTVLTIGLALVNWWVVALGVLLIAAAILAWLWPEAALGETAERRMTEQSPTGKLPVGAMDTRASGWWAMIFVVFTEASLFAYLLFSYYYLAVQPHVPGTFPEGGPPAHAWASPAVNNLILLASRSRWAGRNWASSMATNGGWWRAGNRRRAGA
jgi:hypothetical protein